MDGSPRIVAAMDDLFFMVKVKDAAKKAGAEIEFVKTFDSAVGKAKSGAALLIVDLNSAAVEPLRLIQEVKSGAEPNGVPIVAFLSHVQVEVKQQAQEAGADLVVARSTFSDRLPEILQKFLVG